MGYGNLTIFKMVAVRHVGFWKLAVFIMWPFSARHSASPYKISPKSDIDWIIHQHLDSFKASWRQYFFARPTRHDSARSWLLRLLELRLTNFPTYLLTYLWPKSNYDQNYDRNRWIMTKKANFKMAVAAILNSKNFIFWSRDCNRVQYLM